MILITLQDLYNQYWYENVGKEEGLFVYILLIQMEHCKMQLLNKNAKHAHTTFATTKILFLIHNKFKKNIFFNFFHLLKLQISYFKYI